MADNDNSQDNQDTNSLTDRAARVTDEYIAKQHEKAEEMKAGDDADQS